ncbi:MAG: hypothetical protein M1838_004162 [Thelocarpon superellum]|nr:MAG: hypothetical protein M1838_004162 [Thelocarpon superellum]
MGVDAPLPPPTDSSTLESATTAPTVTEHKELASDISQRTDRTSYSIPDDGSPITISTRRKRPGRERDGDSTLTRASHQSQTSLLIEYFEGARSGSQVNARPSVRVKVTPSAARKIKDNHDHIQISETGRNRQPSYTKRISLSPRVHTDPAHGESGDDRSLSSYASATEESILPSRRPPVEIEVMHKDPPSPRDRRYVPPNPSEISSMPPDSVLETSTRTRTPTRERTPSPSQPRGETSLKTPSRRRSRSLSRERIAQKVIEKLGNKPVEKIVESSSRQKRPSKSRSRSVSKEHIEASRPSPRRRSSRTHAEEDLVSGAESSLVTHSGVSSNRKSVDQNSFRSNTSKSSLNNPRLLEAVEDAIKRLLPELTALKHERRSRHESSSGQRVRRDTVTDIDYVEGGESSRRVPRKTSGGTDRPKVVLNGDEHGSGLVLSGDSVKGRKVRKSSKSASASPVDSYDRGVSEDTVVEEKSHKKRSKDRHTARDALAVGAAGALTAAALRHHDSKSSVERQDRQERQERRKRRSKSRSRSASLAESLESPRPHEIPPMPMSSDIQGSEVTRESILTVRTERPPSATSQERYPHAPDPPSPGPRRLTKAPPRSPRDLETGHGHRSRGDISLDSVPSDKSVRRSDHLGRAVAAGLAAAGITAAGTHKRSGRDSGALVDDRSREVETHDYDTGRDGGLSPIQSVASSREDRLHDDHYRQSSRRVRDSASLASPTKDFRRQNSGLSTDSMSSAASGQLIGTQKHTDSPIANEDDKEYWHEQHQENERNRALQQGLARDPTIDIKHMTNYTDDSMDGAFLERAAAGQHVVGIGANPEYRHTPVAVSSAVASLHEPSVVDLHSTRSYQDSLDDERYDDVTDRSQRHSPSKTGYHGGQREISPEHVTLGASGVPVADDPMPEIGHGLSDESDINTNPSIIQGPIGGIQHENRDHWPYEPTPPHSNGNLLAGVGEEREVALLGAAAGVGLGAAVAGQSHGRGAAQEGYGYKNAAQATPVKDEGYISSANPRSPGGITPEPRGKGVDMFDAGTTADMGLGLSADDPFTSQSHARHLSGNSHGMPSPLYDSATGKGVDRIQSRDVVALMDHLTVRDAQRNARDTEILVTLVRSAAEMRNSFEDMKRFLLEHENHIISTTETNTERSVQKVLHGPRPLPLGSPRGPRRSSAEVDMLEDVPTKRRNVFRRALKGLSMRSTNDLTKIEEMLVQLLGDVEGLKAAQDPRPTGAPTTNPSSYDNLRTVPEGYEPEGQAGTGSTNPTGSGYFSNPPSRQPSAMRGIEGRRTSDHRISTVPEGDEEMHGYDDRPATPTYENTEQVLTPTRQSPQLEQHEQYLAPQSGPTRGASLPLDTPPQAQATPGTKSNENTPRTEKGRKHKSNSSSIFPKISRWSETTASTVARQFRGGARKGAVYSEPASQSGSEQDLWGDIHHDPHGADRLPGLYHDQQTPPTSLDQRAPSPLIPEVPPIPQDYQEDPKYQVHRDSQNLQHPQPRPGPTYRYQNRLESHIDEFGYSPSVTSEPGLSNPTLNRLSGGSGTRYSGGAGNPSPVSDAGYSQASAADQTAPPRPPKIPDEPLVPAPLERGSGQLTPQQVNKSRFSDGSNYSGMNGSPRSASGQVPQRKPTGPRPISAVPNYGTDPSPGGRQRNRNRDTFGLSAQAHHPDDDTF